MRVPVEICVEGVLSAFEAAIGGADRIELCSDLAVGGVTPSAGAISIAKRSNRPLHVLIRPRGGDFCYDGLEFETIRFDIEMAKNLGASGVVIGVLTAEGRVDRAKTAWLIEAARPLSVTFHKAFDATRDPFEALDDLIALGFDRVLTSGHAPSAIEGLKTLTELTRRAAGRIVVMAGGSIRLDQIRTIIEAGIQEIHIGSAACDGGVFKRDRVRQIVELASMLEIFHMATRADWDRALLEGCYRADSLATEGFIHASTSGQVAGSANRFFAGRADLVVLRISLERLRTSIDWFVSPHSVEPFPHIQGPIPLGAVTELIPIETNRQGKLIWPPDEAS